MKKKYNSIVPNLLVLYILTGCQQLSDFGNTNVNPATTLNPVTSAILTNVLSGLGKYSDSYPDFENWASLYCQYFSEIYVTEDSRYTTKSSSPMNYYSEDLFDLQNIIDLNRNESTKDEAAFSGANENQIAVARILKAYIYWTITDRWGDIPYRDALKQNINVNYDTQETIYKDIINELTESVGQFTSGPAIKGDFVYNGDVTKWKKLANSLRMLISLRLSKQYPQPDEYAATQFKSAVEDPAGSIVTNEDNFLIPFEGGKFRNPYYVNYDGGNYTAESATMTSLLQSLSNDQRQTVFGATSNGEPSSLGAPYGMDGSYIIEWCIENPSYCYVFNPEYRKETDPVFLITASHVLLARAEAADRGWTSETPNTTELYQAGIMQSFRQWGLTPPDLIYFDNVNVDLSNAPGTGANLKQIAIQQYIAFYPDGTQGWSNWRRTNYPALTPAPDAINYPPVIPRRYMYGSSDYALTKTGVEAAVARMTGGDKMDSRVWWDK